MRPDSLGIKIVDYLSAFLQDQYQIKFDLKYTITLATESKISIKPQTETNSGFTGFESCH